jgi:energy-converting hydrogenase B subunit D
VLSIYGLILTIFFLLLQAPDVALSELAVGSAALPLMILVALVKAEGYRRRQNS